MIVPVQARVRTVVSFYRGRPTVVLIVIRMIVTGMVTAILSVGS